MWRIYLKLDECVIVGWPWRCLAQWNSTIFPWITKYASWLFWAVSDDPIFPADIPRIKNGCIDFSLYIDGHTTENIIYRWLTNKTETTVFKNEIVIPQFRIEKIAISSTVGHYTVGECHSSVFNWTIFIYPLDNMNRIRVVSALHATVVSRSCYTV
jgi:hypothetical protein